MSLLFGCGRFRRLVKFFPARYAIGENEEIRHFYWFADCLIDNYFWPINSPGWRKKISVNSVLPASNNSGKQPVFPDYVLPSLETGLLGYTRLKNAGGWKAHSTPALIKSILIRYKTIAVRYKTFIIWIKLSFWFEYFWLSVTSKNNFLQWQFPDSIAAGAAPPVIDR